MLKDFDDRNEKIPETENFKSMEETLEPPTTLNYECTDAHIKTNDRADQQTGE
jgi:hypothetical protein